MPDLDGSRPSTDVGGGRDFLIQRRDLAVTTWAGADYAPLAVGQARLWVSEVALTANNITYAAFGERMGYWDFFPAPDGWGRLPVWGFAQVAESRAPGLDVGERVFGCLPISTEVVVSVEGLTADGFGDGSSGRQSLNGLYRNYSRRGTGEGTFDVMEAVLGPLFRTAFLLDDFLFANDYFDAKTIIITSASSKTALALAWLLQRRGRMETRTIGVTSARQIASTVAIGYFDDVVLYERITDIAVSPAIFIDVAGSSAVRAAVHARFSEQLRHSCALGGARWQEMGPSAELPGPSPQRFFAPSQAQARAELWGAKALEGKVAIAWGEFLTSAKVWTELSHHDGEGEIMALYDRVLRGEMSPRAAPVLRPRRR